MGSKLNTRAPSPKIGVPATAVASGSFLSGAMTSLSAFAIPVFLETNSSTTTLLAQWARLYHYGHIYMPALCIATVGLYAYAALTTTSNKSRRYALAAVATISMVPFTWLVMAPTNDTLFGLRDASVGSSTVVEMDLVRGLLAKWAWLHVMRSLSPLVGALVGFMTILQDLRSA